MRAVPFLVRRCMATTQRCSAPAMLNLAKGHPDPTLLPLAAMADACTSISHAPKSRGLDYGSRPQGSLSFLNALAEFISRSCPGEPAARSDCLFVTNGVSHGLELVCSVFTKPGDCVIVEAPTYFLAVGIFQSHGLEIITAPTDSGGLDVGATKNILDDRAAKGLKPPALLYTIPANHNPTGVSLDASRRRELVALAQKRGFLIIADEAYHLLDWRENEKRAARLVCFDEAYIAQDGGQPSDDCEDEAEDQVYASSPRRKKMRAENSSPDASSSTGVVIAASSFTKIMAPGLRLGWLEAEPSIINRLATHGYLASGGCVAPFLGVIVEHALQSQEADRIRLGLVEEYAKRAAALMKALESHGLQPFVKPEGGYFVWVALPMPAKDVLTAGEHLGISFLPGSRCDFSGGSTLFARLCFANLPIEQLEIGAARLAAAVVSARDEKL